MIYNIKYFDGKNLNIFCLSLNDGEPLNDRNNNTDNFFKYDKVMANQISIINCEKISIDFNNITGNQKYIIKNDNYEDLLFDYSLKGHKSYICDYLYIKNDNILISVEYLSPYLIIWDLNLKRKINSVLLPHTDSILCLLNISDKYVTSSGRDRKIFLYSIKDIVLYRDSNKVINNYEIKCNHSSDVYKLNYYKDIFGNNKIISNSFDKTIKIFKMNDNFDKMLSKIILTGHSSSISCVKMDLLRKEIITIDIDSVINRWEYNKKYKIYTIKKSIELNIVKSKKEYIDDIILLYDNLNSIIKIDKTKKIKIFSLSREQFLYEYSEKNEKILKILDFCNFNNFICYSSNNLIKIYVCIIKKIDNENYEYNIKFIKDINIENINFKEEKITCFELLTWKYKLIGIGYNTGKIVIMKIKNNSSKNDISSNQYIIDISQNLDNKNKNKINQIKSFEDSNINNQEYFLYIIISIYNIFFIYSYSEKSNNDLKMEYVNKIENQNIIINFDILNRNIIVSSFMNNYGLEFIYLPKYFDKKNNLSNVDEEPLINLIQFIDENINKIIYTKNKKGIFTILDDCIRYLEFKKN